MCGLAQSTFVITPLNLIGLFKSNSAETEWCAATGTATASAASKAQTVRFILSSSPVRPDTLRMYKSVNVFGPLPRRNRTAEEIVEIVLFAGVFHQHVRRLFDPPCPDIHPVTGVCLWIVDGHRVFHRV